MGVAVAIAAPGLGYAVYYEYYAPPFHNLSWQLPNPGTNIIDKTVGGTLFIANLLSENASGNSSVLLRSISLDSGIVNWSVSALLTGFLPGPDTFSLSEEPGLAVFAYVPSTSVGEIRVCFFNETTGTLETSDSIPVGITYNSNLQIQGSEVYFSGLEAGGPAPFNEWNLSLVTDGFAIVGRQVSPVWHTTTDLGVTNNIATNSSVGFLSPSYYVAWNFPFGVLLATDLANRTTELFHGLPEATVMTDLTGSELYSVVAGRENWSLASLNLSNGAESKLFSVPGTPLRNQTYGVLGVQDGVFVIGDFCGYVLGGPCGGTLVGLSAVGKSLWQVDIDGSINPYSTGYQMFFVTPETVLFVGYPSTYLLEGNSQLSYTTEFLLISVDSGQVQNRVSYGFALSPDGSTGLGSAPAIRTVYAAAVGYVVYSYGANIAASSV